MTPDPPGTTAARSIERRHAARGTSELDANATSVVPDDVLVRQAGLGDKTAFAQLLTRHGPALYRYLFRLLHDHADTEDCVQDTTLAAWKGLPAFRGESAVRTWLFVLARHAAQKHLQRDRPHFPASGSRPTIDVDEVATELRALHGDPESESLDAGLLAALDAALMLLPERQRSVWILREIEQLSYAEVATVVGITPTAVRGLLQRARTTIAEIMKEWR